MALDRAGLTDSFRDLLRADTGTLYGSTRLIQYISSEPHEFINAKTSNGKPNCLYLWSSDSDEAEFRMQNSDDLYSIDFRFVSDRVNPVSAIDIIDGAWERCKVLIRNQMYSGSLMTDYYTDANAQFVDIAITNSALPAPEKTDDETHMVFLLEAAITVQINRWI